MKRSTKLKYISFVAMIFNLGINLYLYKHSRPNSILNFTFWVFNLTYLSIGSYYDLKEKNNKIKS